MEVFKIKRLEISHSLLPWQSINYGVQGKKSGIFLNLRTDTAFLS